MRAVLWCTLLVAFIGTLAGVQSRPTLVHRQISPEPSSIDTTPNSFDDSTRALKGLIFNRDIPLAHRYLNSLHRIEQGRNLVGVAPNDPYFLTPAQLAIVEEDWDPRDARRVIQWSMLGSRKEWAKQQTLGRSANLASRFAGRYGSKAAPSTATTTTLGSSDGAATDEEKNKKAEASQPSWTQRIKQQTVGRAANWAGQWSDKYAGYNKHWNPSWTNASISSDSDSDSGSGSDSSSDSANSGNGGSADNGDGNDGRRGYGTSGPTFEGAPPIPQAYPGQYPPQPPTDPFYAPTGNDGYNYDNSQSSNGVFVGPPPHQMYPPYPNQNSGYPQMPSHQQPSHSRTFPPQQAYGRGSDHDSNMYSDENAPLLPKNEQWRYSRPPTSLFSAPVGSDGYNHDNSHSSNGVSGGPPPLPVRPLQLVQNTNQPQMSSHQQPSHSRTIPLQQAYGSGSNHDNASIYTGSEGGNDDSSMYADDNLPPFHQNEQWKYSRPPTNRFSAPAGNDGYNHDNSHGSNGVSGGPPPLPVRPLQSVQNTNQSQVLPYQQPTDSRYIPTRQVDDSGGNSGSNSDNDSTYSRSEVGSDVSSTYADQSMPLLPKEDDQLQYPHLLTAIYPNTVGNGVDDSGSDDGSDGMPGTPHTHPPTDPLQLVQNSDRSSSPPPKPPRHQINPSQQANSSSSNGGAEGEDDATAGTHYEETTFVPPSEEAPVNYTDPNRKQTNFSERPSITPPPLFMPQPRVPMAGLDWLRPDWTPEVPAHPEREPSVTFQQQQLPPPPPPSPHLHSWAADSENLGVEDSSSSSTPPALLNSGPPAPAPNQVYSNQRKSKLKAIEEEDEESEEEEEVEAEDKLPVTEIKAVEVEPEIMSVVDSPSTYYSSISQQPGQTIPFSQTHPADLPSSSAGSLLSSSSNSVFQFPPPLVVSAFPYLTGPSNVPPRRATPPTPPPHTVPFGAGDYDATLPPPPTPPPHTVPFGPGSYDTSPPTPPPHTVPFGTGNYDTSLPVNSAAVASGSGHPKKTVLFAVPLSEDIPSPLSPPSEPSSTASSVVVRDIPQAISFD
ncbi:hypothetical protein H4R33_006591 [Dimargaris cristalligena]|nr:hypothetical protein H4R33_006591 [Dimargaris cristalligena]